MEVSLMKSKILETGWWNMEPTKTFIPHCIKKILTINGGFCGDGYAVAFS